MNTEELKRLAEPLAGPNGYDSNASWWDAFHRAANPAAILALIAEIESLRDKANGLTGTLERVENERNNQILRNHNLMIELRESRRDNAITMGWQRSAEDWQCPKCTAEIDMEDELVMVLGVVKNMLDNDGHDGRYDAHEFLKARDALRVLIPKNDA